VLWRGSQPGNPLASSLISEEVSVNLVGQTNDAAGTTFYIFQATNAANRMWRVSYQTQIPEGPTAFAPKSQEKLFVFDTPLPAHSTLRFSFPAPEEAVATWCAVLFYEDPPAAWRGRVNNAATTMGASNRVVDAFPRKFAYSQNIPKP
jgi:hypothetical protein